MNDDVVIVGPARTPIGRFGRSRRELPQGGRAWNLKQPLRNEVMADR